MKALTIRRLRLSDAEALYRILSDRQVMRYLEPPYDRLQTEQFLREAGLAEPPLVYGTEEDGRLLGYVIYHAYDPDSMELGWVLSPDCWGKGYASRLTDRLVELAPVLRFPGEEEMRALAEGALRVLHGEAQAETY